MSSDYINYVMSIELKRLALVDFKREAWTKEDYKTKKSDFKPVHYNNISNVNNKVKKIEQTSLLLLDDAIKELLNNGANPLIKDMNDHIILNDVVSSEHWNIQQKLLVVHAMKEEDFAHLPEKEMNNFFIKLASKSPLMQELHKEKWDVLLDELKKKGLTYYQGNHILSDEISLITNNGGFNFFNLIVKIIPNFDFERAYKVNEDCYKTLLEVGEDYMKKPRVNIGSNYIEETIQFIKSYPLYKKLLDVEVKNKVSKQNKQKI